MNVGKINRGIMQDLRHIRVFKGKIDKGKL